MLLFQEKAISSIGNPVGLEPTLVTLTTSSAETRIQNRSIIQFSLLNVTIRRVQTVFLTA